MAKAAARNGSKKKPKAARLEESARILRQNLARRIESLSPERLAVADDFLAYLEERESIAATRELLEIPGFIAEMAAAEKSNAAGHGMPLEKLRRKF